MSGYRGVGQQDPLTGNYNLFQPESLAKYTNPDDLLHKAMQNIAAEEGGSVGIDQKGFYIMKNGKKFERITPERIQEITGRTLLGNPEYMTYMSQFATHSGVDPNKFINQDIMNRAANMSTIYQKDNVWYDADMKGDSIGLRLAEMQAAANPRGSVMPGNVQNTAASKFKINVDPKVETKMFGEGVIGGTAGTVKGYSPTDARQSANQLITGMSNRMANEAPAYKRA